MPMCLSCKIARNQNIPKDAWVSLGRRNRIHFLSGLEWDEEGNRSDGGQHQKRGLEKAGIWGNLNSQESTRVTLAKNPSSRRYVI